MPKKTFSNRGFTLIELMIVLAIIGILVAIIVNLYFGVQKGARDDRRKADLQEVAGALQRFYSDNSQYPPAVNGLITYKKNDCVSTGANILASWGTDGISCGSPEKNYIRQLPHDPLSGTTTEYCYTTDLIGTTANQRYHLFAQMETKGNLTSPASCSAKSYNYEVTSND